MNDYASRTRNGDARPQSPTGQAAIEIENLTVSYGRHQILKGLSLEVPTGSIFGFLGVNGSGKTAAIKTLLGFQRPTSGRARVLGYDVVNQQSEMRMHVGYVSETNSFYDFLTIPQLCALSRDLHQRWDQEAVDRSLKLFELPLNRHVKHFSKGMKSQLALCLALGHDPDLLILDEPTTVLDPVARQVFLKMLIKQVAMAGKTVFFSSHIISEVEAIADHVAVLHAGRLVIHDELDHVRDWQKQVRFTYIEEPLAEEIERLGRLPGVRRIEQEGRAVRLRAEGNVDALVETLQARPYELRNLEVTTVSLEDVLLEFLRGEV
ncbi:ABC transporter ATP-binding protein [Reticulibacter mediterranei]|uniref:ABC transporter ATP-binding protein n=1 Tax=Reticulibacter mediterranei TaxID=2778369 RepID=A0A8J3IYN7_9CHLR|nr:ABC transporter ATP-binding protein [Reticulibacter mediterranei]GHO97641.1 ABC transporter ATP-binding protein [Reticulibacter mediterranei]